MQSEGKVQRRQHPKFPQTLFIQFIKQHQMRVNTKEKLFCIGREKLALLFFFFFLFPQCNPHTQICCSSTKHVPKKYKTVFIKKWKGFPVVWDYCQETFIQQANNPIVFTFCALFILESVYIWVSLWPTHWPHGTRGKAISCPSHHSPSSLWWNLTNQGKPHLVASSDTLQVPK